MTNNAWEKCLKLILLVYLIFAIIGTFAFSTSEAQNFEHSNKDNISSGSYFSSINHKIDWLAENTHTIGKAHGHSNSLLRNGLLRIFTLAGTTAIAMFLAKTNLNAIKNDNIPLTKNLILLKLRI